MSASGRPRALVVFNPAAAGGRAAARWAEVERVVAESFEALTVELDARGAWSAAVRSALLDGVRVFVAAGGDGTVSALADALVRSDRGCPLESLSLGAVGIGSSNDFHKPYGRMVAGLPVRVGPWSRVRDVCRARFLAADGSWRERHFIVSASVGLAAEANAIFSNGGTVQRLLRARWTGGAILYAAQRALAAHRHLDSVLRLNDEPEQRLALNNLSVTKTKWVSGGLRYDTPVAPDDGLLAVNVCEGMTRLGAARMMVDLARGRFRGLPGRRHWRASHVEIELRRPVVLELDGELFDALRVSFEVLAERIRVCN